MGVPFNEKKFCVEMFYSCRLNGTIVKKGEQEKTQITQFP